MKNYVKLLSLLLMTALSFAFTACGSDDSGVDEPTVSASSNKFVGHWSDYKDNTNGTEITFFGDGRCWIFAKSDNPEKCSWTYDPDTKILATTSIDGYSWVVNIIDGDSWSGVSLDGGVSTFKKGRNIHIRRCIGDDTYLYFKTELKGESYESCYIWNYGAGVGVSEYNGNRYMGFAIYDRRGGGTYFKDSNGNTIDQLEIIGAGNREGIYKCRFYSQGKFDEPLGDGEMSLTESPNVSNRYDITFSGYLNCVWQAYISYR